MLKSLSVLILSGILAPLAYSPASAASMEEAHAAMQHRDPMDRFAAMDVDSDGRVSRDEFFKARPSLTEQAFSVLDADKDGFLSAEEWKTFSSGHGGSMGGPGMEAMMKGMRGMGGPRPAGPDAGGAMPPAMGKVSAGSVSSQGMPLVMPPSGSGASGKASADRSVPLVMPPAK